MNKNEIQVTQIWIMDINQHYLNNSTGDNFLKKLHLQFDYIRSLMFVV
jgi:hypothetical protein